MNLELKKLFGRRLRYIRRSRDLTQEQLADITGLSTNFISLLENGDASPSFETLEKLANALETPVFQFFRFDIDK
jgi:transcriptional regulator with XRE-family HTH domain